MSPQEQLQTMLAFDRQGWQVVAIYHSHPHGPLQPSPSDLAEWTYPDALCMIGLPTGELGLWQIVRGKVISVTLNVE
jgi:proteasome lid subunit RPN8/RPN11